jgi:hypothetical protein
MARRMVGLVVVCVALAGAAASDAAVVFCQRKKHVAVRVDACKKNEQLVPAPQGPQGPPGNTGAMGPAGATTAPDSGCPGPRATGVCLLDYSNAQVTSFTAAALQCAGLGGDLCTDSQSWPLSVAFWQNIFLGQAYLQNPHWTASFADNDSGLWTGANGGTGDDHSANSSYGYACCGGTTPPNARVPGTTVNGVKVVAIHNVADTNFSGAVAYCASLYADICSDSQTLLIRDAGMLTVPSWTNSHADNDVGMYNEINGGTNNDTAPSDSYGFACCPSLRPNDLSCPVPTTVGVCATTIHNAADTTFRAAAQACAAGGADLCSLAQAALLRSAGAVTVPVWTNSHSDNDGGNAAPGVGAAMPDNPVLTTGYGYACCIK